MSVATDLVPSLRKNLGDQRLQNTTAALPKRKLDMHPLYPNTNKHQSSHYQDL